MAAVTRLAGDLDIAEDAVQDAFLSALTQWERQGIPANPGSWLIGTARHKALDLLRREANRRGKEWAAAVTLAVPPPLPGPVGDDRLALIFLCCHPALSPEAQLALTLRSVCGLSTPQIAAAFLIPEATIAQRLVRAKRKIREAGIPFHMPTPETLPERLSVVLRVIYLVFTEGHRGTEAELVRPELCQEAIYLARSLTGLLPDEPEVRGLLALLLLTDARRLGRIDDDGHLILLSEQDRGRWDQAAITEGVALTEQALRLGRPGPYQIQAAIAGCHSTAASGNDTDWAEIAALYGELLRYERTAVIEANRAVAVAMVHGPAAGLAILEPLSDRLAAWPPFHIARAGLLAQLDQREPAIAAYRAALALHPPAPERDYITSQLVKRGWGLRAADATAPDA